MSVERIAAAALSIIDADGLGALSMRTLAVALETGTAQLYRYVSGKDEVLVHVLDLVMGEVGSHVDLAGGWRHQVEAMAGGLRATFVEHPNVVPLLSTHVPIGPNALVGREAFLQVLLGGGFDVALAAHGFLALMHYVVGFVLVEVDERADAGGAFDVRRYYESLPPGEFPAITAASAHLTGPDVTEKFALGLALLLDGLEQRGS